MAVERLQKILASAGVASRRKAEEIITAGRVKVNGRVITELGAKADPKRDKIEVDGERVAKEKPVILLMNKPRGVMCTADDPEGRETVLDLVKGYDQRLFPVGRLDYSTSGALLLTNDGDVAFALTHPKHGVEKTYQLKIRGFVDEDVLERWRKGIELEDGMTRPALVHRLEMEENYTWIEVTIKEGRNRQLRRMAEATNLDLVKLKRVAFAGLTIRGVRIGEYRELNAKEEFRLLRDHVNPVARKERNLRGEEPEENDFKVPAKAKPRAPQKKSRSRKPASQDERRTRETAPRRSKKTMSKKPQKRR